MKSKTIISERLSTCLNNKEIATYVVSLVKLDSDD